MQHRSATKTTLMRPLGLRRTCPQGTMSTWTDLQSKSMRRRTSLRSSYRASQGYNRFGDPLFTRLQLNAIAFRILSPRIVSRSHLALPRWIVLRTPRRALLPIWTRHRYPSECQHRRGQHHHLPWPLLHRTRRKSSVTLRPLLPR